MRAAEKIVKSRGLRTTGLNETAIEKSLEIANSDN